MSCCIADWCEEYPIIYTDDKGEEYCVFHAPADEKDISAKEFNSLVIKRINNIHESNKEKVNSEKEDVIDFSYCIFPGFVTFDGITFLPDVNFRYSKFKGDVNFTNTKFKGDGNFRNINFKKKVNFLNSTFEGDVLFRQSTFESVVIFSRSMFVCNGDFGLSTFMSNADFPQSTFKSSANFGGTIFNGYANFQDTKFKSDTNFTHSKITGYANFMRTTFQGAVLFRQSIFDGQVSFSHIKFIRSADFRLVLFGNKTFFDDFCQITQKTDFRFTNLELLQINKLKGLLLNNIRRLNWEDWYKEHPVLKYIAKPFWWISDYGRSTGRIFGVFFGAAILFGLLFYIQPDLINNLEKVKCIPIFEKWDLFWRAMYFSIVTMTTLGFGDMHANPVSNWGYLALSLQVMLGYFLLGALITRLNILFSGNGPTGKFIDDIDYIKEIKDFCNIF